MTTILVVDDEVEMQGALRRILEEDGYEVIAASSGPEALNQIKERPPDLIVLDIIMPEMGGLEVCRRIRADPFSARMPIIFLTAKGRTMDIVKGLDAGGDDYLTKPFEVLELPARIRALLRRAPSGSLDVEAEYLQVGDLRLHIKRPELWIDDKLVDLTAQEHRFVHYLMMHAGHPIPTEQLLTDIWEYPPGTGDPALVYAYVNNIRKKIEPDTDKPRYLISRWGRGYMIDN